MCRGARPDRDWVGHGYTRKTLSVLHGGRLRRLVVHKQRWRGPEGQPVHDRPPRDIHWSRHGLLTVFTAVWTWLKTDRGLHHVEWPWGEERPSRRAAQRWLARLLPDGLRWQQAIRQVVVDHLAPRPLEEEYPAGLPPSGGLARWKEEAATAVGQLARGLTLLSTAPSLNIPRSTLLVGARRSQRELLAGLRFRLEVRGLALVTGPSGAGKSITLRRFVRELPRDRYAVFRICQIPTTPSGFMRSLCRQQGLKVRLHRTDMFDDAQRCLGSWTDQHGTHPTLVFDDAEGMTAPSCRTATRTPTRTAAGWASTAP